MQKIENVVTEDFRKKFNVLDKNETRRERIWKDCVEEAKSLVKISNETRFKIVALAEKCCVIHHGGKPSRDRYTLTRFATEIGMTPKTLMEWVGLKKHIFDNLTPEQRAEKPTYTTLVNISRELKSFNRKDAIGFKAAVTDNYKKLSGKDESTIKMQKYVKHMKTVLWNVKSKAMIKNCDESVLVEILHISRDIAWNLKHIDTQMKLKKA